MKIPEDSKATKKKRMKRFVADGLHNAVVDFILFVGISVFIVYILMTIY